MAIGIREVWIIVTRRVLLLRMFFYGNTTGIWKVYDARARSRQSHEQ
jgi:hypothetical protein